MSRKLATLLLVMLVLAGAMGLKTAVTAHGNAAAVSATGAPMPPMPW